MTKRWFVSALLFLTPLALLGRADDAKDAKR